MIPARRRVVLPLALCAGLLAWQAGCRKAPTGPTVTINGRTWSVEIAMTHRARWQGLSGRTHLEAERGMLFIYPTSQPLTYCMRGCVIPIDIAFIDSALSVVSTHTMAVEPDLAGRIVYASEAPAQYALELPAGALAEAGVKPGHRVIFQSTPDAAKAQSGP